MKQKSLIDLMDMKYDTLEHDQNIKKLLNAKPPEPFSIDHHSKNCVMCDLRTDFISSDGFCELCIKSPITQQKEP
jgi:hypothetical protein